MINAVRKAAFLLDKNLQMLKFCNIFAVHFQHFGFFDPILFSLCPRLAPRRGFVLLFHVKKS